MYVRLAFAVAAHLEPDILLVDEVLAVGDAAFQEKCLGKMGDVAHSGRTVLFVSHNVAAVGRLCTRGILLDEGKVVAEGPTHLVLDEYLNTALRRTQLFRRAKPVDAPVYVDAVSIVDLRGEPTNRVELSEDFTIRIDYVVNQGVRGQTIACIVADLAGNFIISTDDTDLAPERLEPRTPGRYTTEFTVPGRLLNVGEYELLIFASVPKLSQIFDDPRGIYFTVDDVFGSPLFRNSPYRRAALALELGWTAHGAAELAPVSER